MSEPKIRYFTKSLVATRLYGVRVPITWEPCGDGDGALVTSDPNVIAALEQKITARVGGVAEVTEEQYLAKKAEPVPEKRHVTQDPAFLTPRLGNNVLPKSSSNRAKRNPVAIDGNRPALPSASAPEVGKISTGDDAEPA